MKKEKLFKYPEERLINELLEIENKYRRDIEALNIKKENNEEKKYIDYKNYQIYTLNDIQDLYGSGEITNKTRLKLTETLNEKIYHKSIDEIIDQKKRTIVIIQTCKDYLKDEIERKTSYVTNGTI